VCYLTSEKNGAECLNNMQNSPVKNANVCLNVCPNLNQEV